MMPLMSNSQFQGDWRNYCH